MFYVLRVKSMGVYSVIDTSDGVIDDLSLSEIASYVSQGVQIEGVTVVNGGSSLRVVPYNVNKTSIFEYIDMDNIMSLMSNYIASKGVQCRVGHTQPCLSIIRGEVLSSSMVFNFGDSVACTVGLDFRKRVLYVKPVLTEYSGKAVNQARVDLCRIIGKSFKKHPVTSGYKVSLVKPH